MPTPPLLAIIVVTECLGLRAVVKGRGPHLWRNMRIKRDRKTEKKYVEKIRRSYESRERSGVHVSDLLDPRMAYFKKLFPLEITDREIGYFLSGECLHWAIQSRLGIETEKKIELGGVEGSIDVFLEGIPTELKSARNWTIPDLPAEHYVDQVLSYCAITGSRIGNVWVFFLCPNRDYTGTKTTHPEFRLWRCEFTPQELTEERKRLAKTKVILERAWKTRNFLKVPLCHEFKCFYKSRGKAIVSCPYWEKCKPEGRYGKGGKPIVE